MIVPALALLLASAAPADPSILKVKVVSLQFSYPYFGAPGNTCQQGNIFVHAVADSRTPVVVRLVDSWGLTPGSKAALYAVRRAGTGRDGTAVYCADGLLGAAPPDPAQPAAGVDAPAPPPLVQAQPAGQAVETSQPAPAPAGETSTPAAQGRCSSRLFKVLKKPLAEKKFGPSEFDAESAPSAPEVVDCGLARSRVSNTLLLRMVKDGFPHPEAVVGAEWGPGSWQREPDGPQRRAVKVYLVESL